MQGSGYIHPYDSTVGAQGSSPRVFVRKTSLSGDYYPPVTHTTLEKNGGDTAFEWQHPIRETMSYKSDVLWSIIKTERDGPFQYSKYQTKDAFHVFSSWIIIDGLKKSNFQVVSSSKWIRFIGRTQARRLHF
ncbi:hypothetical protein CDAR_12821 [Caerostris darwini]|uniref:Uncharacterized protein n=1 Tax=Caerostris darwini TaxID=1538125 RepID=A0AAV4NAC9_9ARAC|nr:hypothetical protein CDAR_12821 [Caerostris darwini]